MSKQLEIIVVDDQIDLAETTGQLLRQYGHRVSVFHSAQSVLEALDHVRPDLILSDIGMPHMDGCELAIRIKQRPGFEDVILAAITGFTDEEYRHAIMQAGFAYRFIKPMPPSDLRRFVGEIANPSSS